VGGTCNGVIQKARVWHDDKRNFKANLWLHVFAIDCHYITFINVYVLFSGAVAHRGPSRFREDRRWCCDVQQRERKCNNNFDRAGFILRVYRLNWKTKNKNKYASDNCLDIWSCLKLLFIVGNFEMIVINKSYLLLFLFVHFQFIISYNLMFYNR
jgi:hypothetical protein